MPRILFVCHANIARSAAAEFLTRPRLNAGWTTESAGVRALVGEDIDPTIAEAMRAEGASPEPHRARQVDLDMISRADVVFAFESSHRRWLLQESAKSVRKTFMIRGAARVLGGIPRRAAPLQYLASVKDSLGEADDFADPYGRGPVAARDAVRDLRELLDIILPAIDAVPRSTVRKVGLP